MNRGIGMSTQDALWLSYKKRVMFNFEKLYGLEPVALIKAIDAEITAAFKINKPALSFCDEWGRKNGMQRLD